MKPLNREQHEKSSSHEFLFLGTGAGCGVPAFFCSCPACEEARLNPRARRGNCGILVSGNKKLLIDTPPDLRHQLIRENIQTVDALLYTHAHFDHVGGLGELEYMVRLVTQEKLPLYASREAIESIRNEFEYLEPCLDFREIIPFSTLEYDGINYKALPVAHAPGTFGFLITSPEKDMFYACDTGPLPEETARQVRGVDTLILDATYWKKCWTPETHHSVQEAIEEGISLGAKTVYLTHLAMHYDEPITLKELELCLEQYEGRIKVASDGLRLAL